MATSLARQLAALRTPASLAAVQDTAYSGPFLITEANQDNCDLTRLKENISDALLKLIELDSIFGRFTLFLIDDRLDSDNLTEVLDDLLLLLSPYTLLKPAQWVLQYLVIKYKVHYKHPELFFFCVLPFYDYDIYSKAVSAIDTTPGGSKYPNWFPKFKLSCFPTTKLSLYRHTASDRGFLKLLCDLMLRLSGHVTKYPGARVQRQTSFFVMTVLGGLEHCGTAIGEEQVLYLLQVILSGMKSENLEIMASSQILLSYLLPKVTLKEKTVGKLCKSLKKSAKKSPSAENLMLLILIIRTQATVDMYKVMSLVVTLEPAINEVVNKRRTTNKKPTGEEKGESEEDGDLEEFADSIVYSLTLVLKALVPSSSSTTTQVLAVVPEERKILEFVSSLLSTVPLTNSSVYYLTEMVSRRLQQVGKTDQEDMTDADSVAEAVSSLEKILTTVKELYPDEYQKVCVTSENCDLFFFGGQSALEASPDEVIVRAKRVLMDNQLVLFLSGTTYVTLCPKVGDKKVMKLMKSNQEALDTLLLGGVGAAFLLEQLGWNRLEVFLTNLLLISSSLTAELQLGVVKLICSPELAEGFANNNLLRLELLLLPLYWQHGGSVEAVALVNHSHLPLNSGLLAALRSVSPDNPDKQAAVIDKLKLVVSDATVGSVLGDEVVINNPEVLSILLAVLLAKCESDPTALLKSLNCVRLISRILVLHSTTDKFDDLGTENHISIGKLSGSISIKLLTDLLDCLNIESEDVNHIEVLVATMPALYEVANETGVTVVRNCLSQIVKQVDTQLVSLYLCQASRAIEDKTRIVCLLRASELMTSESMAKIVLAPSADNSLLVYLLTQVLDNTNPRIQKSAVVILKKVGELCGGTKNELVPIVNFLLENKSELLSDSANLKTVMKQNSGSLPEKSVVRLFDQVAKVHPKALQALILLFTVMKSPKSLDKVANLGLEMLAKGDEVNGCLSEIVHKFGKSLVSNLSSQSTQDFLLGCLFSPKVVTVAGVQKKLGTFVSERCSSQKLWASVGTKLVTSLLERLLDKAESLPVESKSLLSCMTITPEMFQACLVQVWGEEVFSGSDRVRGRGKFSLLYGSKVGAAASPKNADEEENTESLVWLRTIYLLELLDRLLANNNNSQVGGKGDKSPASSSNVLWETLIPPLFVLLRKTTEEDVEEATYKISLLLGLLLQVFNQTPDTRLKGLGGRDVEPELLTHCIRSCPNPDTRQLALKVLARCSITSPEYVLQNSVSLFTFMGSHILKVDSKHSYQIACESIDVLIPALKTASAVGKHGGNVESTCQQILTTFFDASKDVPEHRYTEFLYRVVVGLGTDSYLWMAMLLGVKGDHKSKNRSQQTELAHRRLGELLTRFRPVTGLSAILRILVNTKKDDPQLRRMFGVRLERRDEGNDEWDILRLSGLMLIIKILSSPVFKHHVGRVIEEDEEEEMRQVLNLLLESCIQSMDAYENLPASVPDKLRRSLAFQAEKVFEQCLSLLPYQLFLSLVGNLLASQNPSIRRRSLEVVSTKLAEGAKDSEAGSLPASALSDLLPPLVHLAVTEDQDHNQQMALLAVRQIGRQHITATAARGDQLQQPPTVALSQPSATAQLTAALNALSPPFLGRLTCPGVLGAAVLAVADVLAAVGAQGVPHVGGIVVWLRETLAKCSQVEERRREGPEKEDEEEMETEGAEHSWTEKDLKVLYSSLLLSLQRIVESFGGFINPQLNSIVILTSRLVNHNSAAVRAKGLMTAIADTIQPHVLLPQAKPLLDKVWDEPQSVAVVVDLVASNSRKLERNKLSANSKQFLDLFSHALSYRSKQEAGRLNEEEVEKAEGEMISAFLTVTLRLCLEDFKPVFQQMTNKLKLAGSHSSLTTLFHLADKCGARLKSLFSFSLEAVVLEASSVLATAADRPAVLLGKVLAALTTLLSYNKMRTVSNQQYEELVSSLLSVYSHQEHLFQPLEDCIVQLAAATEDDSNWKHLNFNVLMCLRDQNPTVRIAVLSLLSRFVMTRADTYLVVLPDAVPFLSEILEDDDQVVENKCRDLIRQMETAFGQNIESYFI